MPNLIKIIKIAISGFFIFPVLMLTNQTNVFAEEFEPTSIEIQVVNLTNAERAKVGVPPLTINKNLTAAARKYAQTMCTEGFFSHTGLDGSTHTSRIYKEGYIGGYPWGENIAAGGDTAENVVSRWMNSSGHKANLLRKEFSDIGVGFAQNCKGYGTQWVQNFGGGKNDFPSPTWNGSGPAYPNSTSNNGSSVSSGSNSGTNSSYYNEPWIPRPRPSSVNASQNSISSQRSSSIAVSSSSRSSSVNSNSSAVSTQSSIGIDPRSTDLPSNCIQPSGILKQGCKCFSLSGLKLVIGTADGTGKCISPKTIDTPLSNNICSINNFKEGCLCGDKVGNLLSGFLRINGSSSFCEKDNVNYAQGRECNLADILSKPWTLEGCYCKTTPGPGEANGIVKKQNNKYVCL